MKSYGIPTRAASGTHEGAGLAGIAAMVGMSLILAGKFDFGQGFLILALGAGALLAGGMYWLRQRRDAKGVRSVALASGGFLGVFTLLGVAVVLMVCRFYWMQLFVGVAVLAGGGVALLLRWLHRRDSHIPVA